MKHYYLVILNGSWDCVVGYSRLGYGLEVRGSIQG